MRILSVLCCSALIICMLSVSAWCSVIRVPSDYATIQTGLNAAVSGDTVLVDDGTYTGTENKDLILGSKILDVLSVNGPEFTVIDCEDSGRGFYLNWSGSNGSLIQGFTIQNGAVETQGGGIYVGYGLNVTVADCIIENCTTTNDSALGCGMSLDSNTTLVLRNSVFSGNHSDNYNSSGTALILGSYSDVLISGCTFSGNIGTGLNAKAGAIRIGGNAVALTISDCVFDGNRAGYGGAIQGGHLKNFTITNCLFTGNVSSTGGSAIDIFDYESFTEMTVQNCTFVNNNPGGSSGAAIDLEDGLDIRFSDCIFWGNSPAQITYNSVVPTVTNCDVQGSWTGTGNIDQDPIFVAGTYQLSSTAAGQAQNSPCIDSGSDSAANICFTTAFGENCFSDLSTRSDDVSDMGVVDMGIHHRGYDCVRHGDVNASGDITAGDALLAFEITLGTLTPSPTEECAADCNGSGDVTAGDAPSIFSSVLGMDLCSDYLPAP